jgi:hypothetical protein
MRIPASAAKARALVRESAVGPPKGGGVVYLDREEEALGVVAHDVGWAGGHVEAGGDACDVDEGLLLPMLVDEGIRGDR